MAVKQSTFRGDLKSEGAVNEFLQKYFYEWLVKNNIIKSFYHVEDCNAQREGVDTVVEINKGNYSINLDEKSAIDYAKVNLSDTSLPTFAFELSYEMNGEELEGWLINPIYLKTRAYVLVWLWVKPETRTKELKCEDILKVEALVLEKKKIQNYIINKIIVFLDLERFRIIAKKYRQFMKQKEYNQISITEAISAVDDEEFEYLMEDFSTRVNRKSDMKWCLTSLNKKAEEPLNIVVNKRTLIDLSAGYWSVTPKGCKDMKK